MGDIDLNECSMNEDSFYNISIPLHICTKQRINVQHDTSDTVDLYSNGIIKRNTKVSKLLARTSDIIKCRQ